MSLAILAWRALFIALGWNFLQYGFGPPDGGSVGAGSYAASCSS